MSLHFEEGMTVMDLIIEMDRNEFIDGIVASVQEENENNNKENVGKPCLKKNAEDFIAHKLICDIYDSDPILNIIPNYEGEDAIEFERPSRKMEILEFSNVSMHQIVTITKSLKKDLGKKLFGVLVSGTVNGSSRSRFNPFHPHVAAQLSFMYETPKRNMMTKPRYNAYFYYVEHDDENCPLFGNSLVSKEWALDFINEFTVKMMSASISMGGETKVNVLNKYCVEVIKDENSMALVPVQIANVEGVAYPYYGEVLVMRGDYEGIGRNIFPYFSPNVTFNTEGFANICTGRSNNMTRDGWMTLNHANFTSPLNSSMVVFREMTPVWHEACIEYSLRIYEDMIRELGLEKEPRAEENVEEAVPDKPMNFHQYKEKNPDATMKSYIEYVREFNQSKLKGDTHGNQGVA